MIKSVNFSSSKESGGIFQRLKHYGLIVNMGCVLNGANMYYEGVGNSVIMAFRP